MITFKKLFNQNNSKGVIGMNKKALALGLALTMSIAMVGCGKGKSSGFASTEIHTTDNTSHTDITTADTTEDITTQEPATQVKITPNETASIEYEQFDTLYYSVKIPKGWTVTEVNPYTITHSVVISNPDNPNYAFGFQLYYDAILKSQAAWNMYQDYYGSGSNYMICEGFSTEAYVSSIMAYVDRGTNFNVIQNFGVSELGGDVLNATMDAPNGQVLEGIFTATLHDMGSSYVWANPMDPYSGEIDIMPYVATDLFFLYAPEEDFINWEPIMAECLDSFQYTEKFHQDRQESWALVMQTSYYIAQCYNYIGDMIMDSWNYRNTVHDISTQKYADTILGYERVYDSTTGEVYLAPIGWSDTYTGTDYILVTDDSYYTIPTSGYIE